MNINRLEIFGNHIGSRVSKFNMLSAAFFRFEGSGVKLAVGAAPNLHGKSTVAPCGVVSVMCVCGGLRTTPWDGGR